jgi:anti-sigma regulatory factor (Ser/Thr protein kinase)
MASNGDRFAIELPADAAYLSTVRLFVSAIARHYGVKEENLEDLKLAVTEACSAFLRYEEPGRGALHLQVTGDRDRLTVEVTSPDLAIPAPSPPGGDGVTPTPRGVAAELGMDLIRSLFEDSDIVAEGTSRVRFSIPLPG